MLLLLHGPEGFVKSMDQVRDFLLLCDMYYMYLVVRRVSRVTCSSLILRLSHVGGGKNLGNEIASSLSTLYI